MRSFSLFLLRRAHASASACLLCVHIYVPVLCANLEPIIIVMSSAGCFFFIQERNETKSSRDRRVVQLKRARGFFRFVIS